MNPTITIERIDNGWVVTTPTPPFGSGERLFAGTPEAVRKIVETEVMAHPPLKSAYH